MSTIIETRALEIIDSRGNPTIYAEVILDNGLVAGAAVPSGASTGKYEACELRDQDEKRFHGKGVKKAVEKIHKVIAPKLKGRNPLEQYDIDMLLKELDGTREKSRLGANAILGVSMAVCRAASLVKNIPLYEYVGSLCSGTELCLPTPMMNVINGGAHADNALSIQEFMIVPHGFDSFSEALRAGAEIFQTLKGELKQNNYNTNVGDEGGFAPDLRSNEEALDFLLAAIEKTGYKLGDEISLALDVAATELYRNNIYTMQDETHDGASLVKYYEQLVKTYPIISIEDALAEEDWEHWQTLTEKIGKTVQVVGDDLFVTNTDRLIHGIETASANAILIKLNQIGTVSETLDAIKLADSSNFASVVSHRSGETEDSFIADLAVGTGAGQIKTGSLSRSDRIAKYNRLLHIEAFSEKNIPFSAGRMLNS